MSASETDRVESCSLGKLQAVEQRYTSKLRDYYSQVAAQQAQR